MTRRFVTVGECVEGIKNSPSESEAAVWEGLKDAIEKGYFVLYNEETEKFCIVEPGTPINVVM